MLLFNQLLRMLFAQVQFANTCRYHFIALFRAVDDFLVVLNGRCLSGFLKLVTSVLALLGLRLITSIATIADAVRNTRMWDGLAKKIRVGTRKAWRKRVSGCLCADTNQILYLRVCDAQADVLGSSAPSRQSQKLSFNACGGIK